jgi:hypothetical protein
MCHKRKFPARYGTPHKNAWKVNKSTSHHHREILNVKNDVARERAKFELRQGSPQPLSATNAARDAAHLEVAVRLPLSDDTRAGGDERRAEELTSSISAPPAEDGTLGTRRPERG